MSHWQTGKLELKCSLNILKKALINIMPEWEEHIQFDEHGKLQAKFHGNPVKNTFHLVVSGSSRTVPKLYSDIGLNQNQDGTWEIGGDYSVGTLKQKLTGEVMRMKALAIAQMRGYEVLRNKNGENEIITDIRVDIEKAKELMV
jgi:hypothetical protein